jgi:hypothetical protein
MTVQPSTALDQQQLDQERQNFKINHFNNLINVHQELSELGTAPDLLVALEAVYKAIIAQAILIAGVPGETS